MSLAARWGAWVRRLDKREDAAALAVCRVLVGLTVVSEVLDVRARGVARVIWVDAAHGGLAPLRAPWWLPGHGAMTEARLEGWLFALVLSASALAAGLATPLAAGLTWFLSYELASLHDGHGNGADSIVANTVFVLTFSGCGRALSLDNLLLRRLAPARFAASRRPEAPAWPRYVLIFLLSQLYFFSGVQKISAGWVPGGPADALWYILQQPTWQRRDFAFLAPAYRVTQVATLVTWVWETLGFVLLLHFLYRATASRPGRLRAWFNRHDARRAYLLTGLLVHGGIWATMEIGPFLPSLLALYACCLHPSEVRAALARVARALPRRGAR